MDLTAFVDHVAITTRTAAKAARTTDSRLIAASGRANVTEVSFCDVWPVVKSGLELLKGIVPPWAVWLIDAVIRLGSSVCA